MKAAASAVRPRICFVVSSAMTAEAFLTRHVRALAEHYEVHLAANAQPESINHADLRRAVRLEVPIQRSIAPLQDIAALVRLARILRGGGYSAVHSITPKAGLLTALAAFIARVPTRIHIFTGQVWVNRRGAPRRLLKTLDWLIARLNTHILVDSASQRDFLQAEGVLRPHQGVVIGPGSVCGVDVRRFIPNPAARAGVRATLEIAEGSLVILFVGRLTRDKGVLELACAYSQVAAARRDVHLMIVGPDEEALQAEVTQRCGPYAKRVHFIGHTAEPERYMAAADVFCLPSHREGFGSVILEAAACGLPAVGSHIYGITDAIQGGVTGLLVNVGDIDGLASALLALAEDELLRGRLALAARDRALSDFSSEALTKAWLDFYARVVATTARASTQEASPKGT